MNVWESPKGCLLFSFTIQMEDGRIVPLVQYVVSLAMTEAINDVCTRDVSVFLIIFDFYVAPMNMREISNIHQLIGPRFSVYPYFIYNITLIK